MSQMARKASLDLSEDQVDRLREGLTYLVHVVRRAERPNYAFDAIMETGTQCFLDCEEILREIGDV